MESDSLAPPPPPPHDVIKISEDKKSNVFNLFIFKEYKYNEKNSITNL